MAGASRSRVYATVLGRHGAGLRLEGQLVVEAHDPDGRVGDSSKVLEVEPWRRPVLSWRNEFRPELKSEGYSCMTYLRELDKLTVTHRIDRPDSKFIEAVSNGWPIILSSLKSLLETGESLEATRRWPGI